ncbi:MAG: acetyltransferase [Clostridia bacterium]|nr:acetyltransferase [Clostridia bacterium]
MKRLMIVGAGGHGSVVADAAIKSGYEDVAFLDDGKATSCLGYPVVGKTADAEKYQDFDFFVAIGNAKIREKVSRLLLEKGLNLVNIIHPSAVVAKGVVLGKGVLLAAGAIVNPNARIEDGVIVNTQASIDHDDVVGAYAHVSVGAHLAGEVKVGAYTWVGIGAVISNGLSVCEDCMIGAGATVVKDITQKGTYIGTPAKRKA